jgi:hypothetical protein
VRSVRTPLAKRRRLELKLATVSGQKSSGKS